MFKLLPSDNPLMILKTWQHARVARVAAPSVADFSFPGFCAGNSSSVKREDHPV
jgi:hypothetical protein